MKQAPDSSDSGQDEDSPPVEHIYSNIAFEQDFEVRDELLNDLNDRLEAAPVEVQAPLAAFVPKGDEYQQQVIDSSAHTLRVVAPAGSGKTQTMLNRVLRRIQQGSNPERLLLLTFDNAAASSLTTKLRQQTEQLGVDLRSLQIKTLNAFGFGLLRQYVPGRIQTSNSAISRRSAGKRSYRGAGPEKSGAL